MGAMDEGILAEFLAESFENLAQVELDLVALERDPEDRKRIGGIFRAVHTIKGTCGFFGLKRLEALAHAGENLLSRLRCGEMALTPEIADALLRLVDALYAILSRIETTRQEGNEDFASLVEELARLDGGPIAGDGGPAAPGDGGPAAAGAPAPALAATPTPESPTPDTPFVPAAPPAPTPIEPVQDIPGGPPRGGLLDPLIAVGKLDPDAVALAAQQQRLGDPRRIGEILVDNGALKPQDVLDALLARGEAPALALGENTIRVDVGLLDLLMNLVGELVLARNQLLQKVACSDLADLPGTTQRLNLITTELQEGIMKTRMQPIANLCNKLPRLVRDLSIACGKEVRLELEGIDTELDRTIIDAIRDPLTHLIRNAVDHGIEPREVRLARGKPVEGRVLVRAYHEGGKVHVEVADDGDGLPIARIREKALRAGLVSAERVARMTDRDWAQLIFQPGFSTAERITNISGRGVGMDVVKTNVERIGGAIEVDSQPGRGATTRIRIPLTLAIVPALIVSAAGERYAIPQVNLLELARVEGDLASISITTAVDASLLRYRGGLLPLIDLRQALRVPEDDAFPAPTGARPIAVLQADGVTFGLVVDSVEASQEIVVKSLGDPLRQIPVFAGATILGDGKVALILDVPGLARHSGITIGGHHAIQEMVDEAPAPVVPMQTLVLCRAGGYPVAIPQADIARLEEFPRGMIERLGERRVVQYRGGLLTLVPLAALLGAGAAATAGAEDIAPGEAPTDTIRVVVVERAGRAIGLSVEEIVEILEEPIGTGPEESPRAGVRGSAVIRGRATDLLDLDALLASRGEPALATGA